MSARPNKAVIEVEGYVTTTPSGGNEHLSACQHTGVPARLLGLVERMVGLSDQAGVVRMAVVDCDANTDGHRQLRGQVDALATLRRRNELVLNSAGEGILGLDREGRTTFLNPAVAEMTGWRVEDLLGKPLYPLLYHSGADGSPFPTRSALC